MIATQNIDKKILEEVEMKVDIENALMEKATQNSDVLTTLYTLGSKMEFLTKEEKNLLAVQAKKGDKKAIEKLTIAHVRMIIQVALKKYKQMYTVPINASLEDLVMAGCSGLGDAIKHFDPRSNPETSFTTYAMYFITKEINQAYLEARPIRVSGHIMERTIMMKKTYDLLHDVLKHNPSIEELYEYYEGEYSKDIIQETLDLIQNTGMISLYEKFGGSDDDEDGGMLINVLADDTTETPEEIMIRNDKSRIIREAVDRLPKREAVTIRCLFGLTDDNKSYTLVETAQILSKLGIDGPKGKPMSKQHICNIRDIALAKLKETLAGIALD